MGKQRRNKGRGKKVAGIGEQWKIQNGANEIGKKKLIYASHVYRFYSFVRGNTHTHT